MAERRMGLMLFLFCLCLCLMPCKVRAASTSDATELISPERTCSLTVSYGFDGTAFSDLEVSLYRIADVSSEYQYTLTAPFASSGLILNGIQTQGEWNVVRSTLEAHILAGNIAADQIVKTDQNGQVCFASLKTGLYLAVVQPVVLNEVTYVMDSALISLPGLGNDGRWQYQVTAVAKPRMLPPTEPDSEIQLKVVKLWKGDQGLNKRPKSVEVEIFRNGIGDRIVTLSEENHWSYSWTAKDDGATWLAVEWNVPEGYVVTLDVRGNTFVLTNTLSTEQPGESPIKPPKTGDTSNILLYTILIYVAGIILIILGITGKRKRK